MKKGTLILLSVAVSGFAAATDFGWILKVASVPRVGIDTKEVRNGPSFLDAQNLYITQRANENGRVDWTAFDRAAQARDAMQMLAFKGDAAPAWTLMGPHNQDVPFRLYFGTSRSTSGRVTCMAWDPSYNSKIVYAGSAGGGVWKSTDSGVNWTCVSDQANWAHLQVSSIALDPKKPTTIYAGTGGSRGFLRLYGFGIMKSTNSGATWTQLNSFDGVALKQAITDIVVHPDDTDLLFATTHGRDESGAPTAGKVYRSQNGGTTFLDSGLPAGAYCDLSISLKGPRNDPVRAVYAAGFELGGNQKVYRTINQGAVWDDVTPNTFTAFAPANIRNASVHVAASASNYKTVYAQSGSNMIIAKSLNRGTGWDNVTGDYVNGAIEPPATLPYNWTQSGYDAHLTCAPVFGGNRDVLYSGLITLHASDAGGTTWKNIGRTFDAEPAMGVLNRTHNDQHCIVYNPSNPSEVLIGNDGGVYRVVYDPIARTWSDIEFGFNKGLTIGQFYAAAVVSDNADKAMGGTQDNATPRSYGENSPQDAGVAALAKWNNAGGGDGGWTHIDPLSDLLSYTSSNGTMWRSGDGWKTTILDPNAETYILGIPLYTDAMFTERLTFLCPSDLDVSGSHLFVSSLTYLYRYAKGQAEDNFGFRLDRKVYTDPPTGFEHIRYRLGPKGAIYRVSGQFFSGVSVVAVAPGAANVVYVGTNNGSLFMTRNALNADVTTVTFTQIQNGTSSLPARPITALAVHPFKQNEVWAGVGGTGTGDGHLFWCSDTMDATRTWTSLGTAPLTDMDIPINAIALDPDKPDQEVYVGNDVGAFMSVNGGVNWSNITRPNGLPNVQVNALEVAPSAGKLIAGTFGRGMYVTAIRAAKIQALGCHPNPIKRNTSTRLCRVVLSKPAPNGGVPVTFASSHPAIIAAPANMTIAEGQVVGEFSIKVLNAAAATAVTISATASGETRSTPVKVTL